MTRWIVLLLRGGAAIAAGLTVFVVPPGVTKTLVAAYLLADGILGFGLAPRFASGRRARLLVAADSLADLVVATLLFVWVPTTGTPLVFVIAVWAIGTGIIEIAAAIFVPRLPELAWSVALAGLASCALGIVAVDWTSLAEIGLLYLFGAYALAVGVLFVTAAVLLSRGLRPPRDDGLSP